MRGSLEQAAVDDWEKDRRKNRRRPNRRPKLPGNTVSVCTSINDCDVETATFQGDVCKVKTLPSTMNDFIMKPNSVGERSRTSNPSSNCMPSMHMKGEVECTEGNGSENSRTFCCNTGRGNSTNLCPELVACRGSLEAPSSLDIFPVDDSWQHDQNKCFAPHWPTEVVEEALEKGDVFRALFRVNAYNRHEAYCKIDGVPVDILINGFAAQNRAVEGDIVAIKVDPTSYWTRMKGTLGISTNSVPTEYVKENSGSCGKSSHQRLVMDAKAECAGNTIHSAESDRISSGKCCHLGPESNVPSASDYELDRFSSGKSCHLGPETNVPSASDYELDWFSSGKSCLLGPESNVPSVSDYVENGASVALNDVEEATLKFCRLILTYPSKRPTGRVVAIIKKSRLRGAVVGFLNVKQWIAFKDGVRKYLYKNKNTAVFSAHEFIQFTPIDNRFPKMMVLAKDMTDEIRKRLFQFDGSAEMELVGSRVDEWNEDCALPYAHVVNVFGRGDDIGPQIDAILFANAICSSEFFVESFLCLPCIPWDIPLLELEHREDLRNLCIFSIDPSTATDLDDALSIEVLATGICRVGVHIADVSYFVQPNTALDKEAQLRSTSVDLIHKKVPMLPQLLSEDVGSLNPGVDRLAFSIFWDINYDGHIIDRRVIHTVIHSCCKLSYDQAYDIIRGVICSESNDAGEESIPQVCGNFKLSDVISAVKYLHEISTVLNKNRFRAGALRLETPKIEFSLDEHGLPSDCFLSTRMDSNFLVEEFMLLANKTAAEVISRAFPDAALLRRHPEPSIRKRRDLGNFCSKHGLELDTSSSGAFHKSLELVCEKLKDDPVLFDILVLNATKSMQLASYFCTTDRKEDEWGHYALAVPLYTHFTSPLRRYPDILVHRMLAAAMEAELSYSKSNSLDGVSRTGVIGRCFSGISFDKKAVEESDEVRKALSAAAMKHGVPSKEVLVELAAHCNERKLVSRDVKDATTKLYIWAFLRINENSLAEARVLALGPRFMSIYIPKLAIERRIYYDDVERFIVEWLEFTSTLVISLSPCKLRQSYQSKCPRALEDVAMIKPATDEVSTTDSQKGEDLSPDSEIDPCVFPLTVQVLSTIPVVLCAIGSDNGPIDISARLYMTSYL